ncbi:hypothetical protein [Enterobacter chengduensis]|uniref:hypothetical protein n=1 Tax=Enterobacter chengduensis TaxID=2494701 RepID=UPI001FF24166|nr:hypothetical protein [Enterobacter chengduensis]MCK1099879.1 hypothetical protein [Enterobacter chengduensis]
MANITKIPFSFCRIKRAAELLDIQAEDLLSLSVSGKITLCVRLDGLNSILLAKGNADELDKWFLSLKNNNSVLANAKNLSNHTSFSIDNLSNNEDEDVIFHPRFYQLRNSDEDIADSLSQSHGGRAFGLWVPPTRCINDVLNYGTVSMGSDSLGIYRTDDSTPDMCLIPLAEQYLDDVEDEDSCIEHYAKYEISVNDLWITAEQVKELVKHNGDYNDLPSNEYIESEKRNILMNSNINHMAEHHATNREKLYRAAIHLLSKYPEECRGERKEISPEKWRDCILAHKNEIQVLPITNEDVILKHLRSAANGKR